MSVKLAAARKRFASRAAELEREILQDPDFRSLCEDYGEAVAALERWSSSSHPSSPQRVSEYQNLVRELEEEIQSHLHLLSGS